MLALAFDPFVIKDIRVEGIQRTEAGTVFSYMPVKVGDTFDEDKAASAIKSLYATGFFKDVRLEVENDVLIVTLEERPAIAQISISGTKEFNEKELKERLKQIGLVESHVFDKLLLDRAEQELKRQYLDRAKYSVEISTTVTPLERNRVGIAFSVSEGAIAKIRQINIVGNKVYKEKTLLKMFSLTTPGLLTWYTKNDQYSKQKIAADLEKLRSYYLDRGYLEFNIDSTQVSITSDKKDIYVTINLTEGTKYTVDDIKLAGELLVPEAELRSMIKVKNGETFSRSKLTESTKLIADRLSNDGYAFANVNAVPELRKKDAKVAFTFFIDAGRRVYVRRINVTGNDKTRDEVIRREFRQMEGGWYSGDKIEISKRRVDKLGYFSDVNIETPAISSTTDQVDVNINVTEKATGNILLGAGYSDSDGLLLNGRISQNNIFGSGNQLSVQFSTGDINKIYSLSYTNPYYTFDGVSRGFDLYRREVNSTDLTVTPYQTKALGGVVRFVVPINETDSINYSLGIDKTDITAFTDSTQAIRDFVSTFGGSNITLLGTIGWARDGRDSGIYPTKGSMQKASGEIGLPGSDLTYYKLLYEHRWYYPLSDQFTLMLNGEAGLGDGYSKKPLPFYKNFYAGGSTSVRGYESSSLGPKDSLGNALGGTKRLLANAEVLFPLPILPNDKSVRMSVFLDSGMVNESFDTSELRYSSGLALSWISPVGPLKISFAQPLNDKVGDRTQKFQFTFGF